MKRDKLGFYHGDDGRFIPRSVTIAGFKTPGLPENPYPSRTMRVKAREPKIDVLKPRAKRGII